MHELICDVIKLCLNCNTGKISVYAHVMIESLKQKKKNTKTK